MKIWSIAAATVFIFWLNPNSFTPPPEKIQLKKTFSKVHLNICCLIRFAICKRIVFVSMCFQGGHKPWWPDVVVSLWKMMLFNTRFACQRGASRWTYSGNLGYLFIWETRDAVLDENTSKKGIEDDNDDDSHFSLSPLVVCCCCCDPTHLLLCVNVSGRWSKKPLKSEIWAIMD